MNSNLKATTPAARIVFLGHKTDARSPHEGSGCAAPRK
eukprot:CAMPEP_0177540552 /NCGR_PEP_ID=MMETSP0369-20130122/59651_1 /TAXON_ID=447022 ORGANISM="Scrippsiella hangoei-like, Strain SHHI-4" /NCGR_SAMPLE_ID=MMETSP0369 /ASSEMBLY_ACC=CAM_ASM_000364 /LENGTH=37 /DNA_ID= /DNA_START= /DNA_END= /DNA_ORIENTATION=